MDIPPEQLQIINSFSHSNVAMNKNIDWKERERERERESVSMRLYKYIR